MSDFEWFAQIAQDKWVTMSDSLRLLTKNEQPWASRSGRSPKKSDHEQFAQVSHQKCANRSFFRKKRAICSENRWANSQPCVTLSYMRYGFRPNRWAVNRFCIFTIFRQRAACILKFRLLYINILLLIGHICSATHVNWRPSRAHYFYRWLTIKNKTFLVTLCLDFRLSGAFILKLICDKQHFTLWVFANRIYHGTNHPTHAYSS